VPVGGDVCPTFTPGLRNAEKKKELGRFLIEENNVQRVIVTEEVLKNKFLEAVPKDYYLELNAGVPLCNGSPTLDLFTHVMSKYAKLDDHLVKENR
jgi:hypothetical protein